MNRRRFLHNGLFIGAVAPVIFIPRRAFPAPFTGAKRSAFSYEVATAGAALPSPIAWWKFTEGSGATAADSSGNGYTLNLKSGTSWVTGKSGSGYSIQTDGTAGIGQSASNIAYGTDKITMCCWYSTSYTTGVTGCLWCSDFANSSNVGMLIYNNTTWRPYVLGSVANDGAVPLLGAWHHLAQVINNHGTNASIDLYIDGSFSTTVNLTGPGAQNVPTASLGVGVRTEGAKLYANSRIDDFRLYPGLLTSGQISSIYNDPQ